MPATTAPPAIITTHLTSKALPACSFPDAVEQLMGRDVMGFDFRTADGSTPTPEAFRFDCDFHALSGGTVYTHVSHTPSHYRRTTALLKDGLDEITVTATHSQSGGCIVRHGHREIALPSGSVLVVAKTRAHEVLIPWRADTYTLQMPRAAIAGLLPGLEEAPLHIFAPGAPGADRVALAMSYAALFTGQGTLAGTPLVSAVGHLHELVASAIDARWAASLPPEHAAASSARLALLQRSVRARLGDADLSLDTLARLCHKSPRAVQQQFANVGTSFTEFLADARLERARDLLTNPVERRLVLEIALECGFTNFPAFSRAFRRRFGMTPTDARALSHR